MKQVVAWIETVAQQLGGFGLFIVSLLDSSILPLPEVNDVLLVFSVASHERRMPFYAAMATLGSVAGCFIVYYIGAKGGHALLKRRFQGRFFDRAVQLFQKYGMMAIVVPAILPPPAPFKLFVLMAGTSRMSKSRFALALTLGRGFRFFGIGLLAVWYGDQAIQFVQEHGGTIAMVVGLTVLAAGLCFLAYRARRTKAD
jgi:membrane protein YqaA with SNARE-associated domain